MQLQGLLVLVQKGGDEIGDNKLEFDLEQGPGDIEDMKFYSFDIYKTV
jgi:hypothetical protein